VTISYMGLPACFYLNAISFLAVIFALAKIKSAGKTNEGSQGIMKDLAEGLRFVKNKPEIYRTIKLITIFSLIALPFITLLPVFAGEVLKKGSKGFGFLVGATGAGALSAALTLAFKGDIENKNRFMAFSALCVSFSLLVFSLSENFALSLVVLVFIGWGLVSFLATANSFIQLSTPDNLRGRAMSVYTFVFLGTAPIGNSLMGTVAKIIGTTKAVSISALICIVISVFYCVKIYRR